MINVPLNNPKNKAEKTSLKSKANNIAISGGIIESQIGTGFIIFDDFVLSHSITISDFSLKAYSNSATPSTK